jgi:hypothetical protein
VREGRDSRQECEEEHIEELHNLHSANNIWMFKSRRTRWTRDVTRMWDRRLAFWGFCEEIYLRVLGIGWKVLLKFILLL